MVKLNATTHVDQFFTRFQAEYKHKKPVHKMLPQIKRQLKLKTFVFLTSLLLRLIITLKRITVSCLQVIESQVETKNIF